MPKLPQPSANPGGLRPAARVLAMAMAGCADPVFAVDDKEDGVVQLSPVQVTAGRQTEGVLDVPQPVTVLTRRQIERRSPQVMTELLRGQPGAFFQQTGPGQGIVIVRGLKGAEVLHLVDGFRLNNAFFRTAPSQYIALLDPYNISQLELLRGPYATLYGSDAMGGVVQVLTPEQRFGGEQPELRGGVRVQYGSSDLSRASRVWGATGMNGFSVSAGVTSLDYGSRKLAAPGQSADGTGGVTLRDRVQPTAYGAHGFDFKAIWSPSSAQELMFSVQRFKLPSLPRYNEVVPGFGSASAGKPEAAQSLYFNSRDFYHLRYRYNTPLAFVDDLEVHLGHQVIFDDRFDRSLDLSTDSFEFNKSSLSGLTLQAHTALGESHRLTYGVELYSDRVDSSKREVKNGMATINGPSAGVKSRFPDGARADNYGVYLAGEWRATQRWLLDAGVRYNLNREQLPQADRLSGAEIRDRDLTGSFGTRYALTDTLAWTVNAGRGFRAPNINDLAQVGRRSNGRITIANPALKPESVVSVDTGLKWADSGLLAEASVFYAEYKDRITIVPTGVLIANGTRGCNVAAGCPEVRSENIAQAAYYGFEGALRYEWRSSLAVFSSLNYTFGEQDIRGVTTPGNRVPPLNGETGIEYRPWPALSVQPSVFYAGRQDRLDASDRADNRINPQGTPGYVVLNVQLAYRPTPAFRLQLDGLNLLDKAYREHGSGIDGAARGVVLTAQARFD